MSITTDLRAYADKTVATAQAQLNDVTGQANELVGKLTDQAKTNVSDIREKATEAVTDLRTSAEKAVNLDALKSTVEPYLTQVKGIQAKVHEQAAKVQERIEALLEKGKSDPRFGSYVQTFEARVVKPYFELANRGLGRPETPAPVATVTTTTKKAPARAAATTSAAKASTTRTAKATAAKAPAKKAPAKKAPATKA